jgi:hypothetical protein
MFVNFGILFIRLQIYRTRISKRPEGMHREVFALLYKDSKDAPPLLPTDSGMFDKLNNHKNVILI